MAIDDEFTEYELDVARAIVRLRELFQSAPYLVSDNNVPGLGIVTWRDLKTLQIYADNEFESRRPLRTPSQPAASGGVEFPALPDDDADFTPDLARKIIAKYQELLRRHAQSTRMGVLK